jgi:hypothetical protein
MFMRFWLEIAYYNITTLISSSETAREERGDDENVRS